MNGIILIDVLTYLLAIGALAIVRIPQPKVSGPPQPVLGSMRQDIAFGFRYLRARSGLLGLLLYFALVNYLLNSTAVVTGPLVLSQSKVDPAVQGRVFAIRSMISRSMMPLAFAGAGPLTDSLFEPWMRQPGDGVFAAIGGAIGTGPGRGMGLMLILGGVALLIATLLAAASPRIRLIEQELPDAHPEAGSGSVFAGQQAHEAALPHP